MLQAGPMQSWGAGGEQESHTQGGISWELVGSLSHVAEPHPAPAMTVRRRVWLCA